MIRFLDVCKSYGVNTVLENFSLHIKPGEIVSLFGPNGCGKSTALRLIAGLETPDRGLIICNASAKETALVPQNYRESLLPWRTPEENIIFGLELRGVSKSERHRRLDELQQMISISFDLQGRTSTLSGGQAQLTALLRAVVLRPKLLLLDEPTAALDYFARGELLRCVRDLREAFGFTVVVVLHDLGDAENVGDWVCRVGEQARETADQRCSVLSQRPAINRY